MKEVGYFAMIASVIWGRQVEVRVPRRSLDSPAVLLICPVGKSIAAHGPQWKPQRLGPACRLLPGDSDPGGEGAVMHWVQPEQRWCVRSCLRCRSADIFIFQVPTTRGWVRCGTTGVRCFVHYVTCLLIEGESISSGAGTAPSGVHSPSPVW